MKAKLKGVAIDCETGPQKWKRVVELDGVPAALAIEILEAVASNSPVRMRKAAQTLNELADKVIAF